MEAVVCNGKVNLAENEASIRKHTQLMRTYVKKEIKKYPILCKVSSVEDIVQEVWVKILSNPDTTSYDPEKGATLSSFLYLICSSVVKDVHHHYNLCKRRIPYTSLQSMSDTFCEGTENIYFEDIIEDVTETGRIHEVEFTVDIETLERYVCEDGNGNCVSLRDVCIGLSNGECRADIAHRYNIKPALLRRYLQRTGGVIRDILSV